MKLFIIGLTLFLGLNAYAKDLSIQNAIVNATVRAAAPAGLDWKVGDSADYNLNMGFIPGKMHTFVREFVDRGIWMQQDVELGPMGSQVIEVLFDKNTGQVLEVIANGQKQTPPDAGDMEVIDMKESSVTVPAGTFDCIYAKILSKKDNKESEAWINPEAVPMSGMIKTIAPGPLGKVTIEMTAFNKQ